MVEQMYRADAKVYIFLTWTQSGTLIEISLCYFTNVPQRDKLISFYMKHVITVLNISIDLIQRGLIWPLRRDHFIMNLINLLIRGFTNCSLGGDFWVSSHAEICQFDRFSIEINFKRARSCNYGIPRLIQVKAKILYAAQTKFLLDTKADPTLKQSHE